MTILVFLLVVVVVGLGLTILRMRTRYHALAAARAAVQTDLVDTTAALRVAEEATKAAHTEAMTAIDTVARLRRESGDLTRELKETTIERDDVVEAFNEAEATVVSLRSKLATMSSGGLERVEVLWTLEMARLDRAWRTSVSVDPAASSGLIEADDIVAAALHIEASVAREEIGTDVEVDCGSFTSASAEEGLVAIRAVHEAISDMARQVDDLHIDVRIDDDSSLVLRVSSEGEPLEVPILTPWVIESVYRF